MKFISSDYRLSSHGYFKAIDNLKVIGDSFNCTVPIREDYQERKVQLILTRGASNSHVITGLHQVPGHSSMLFGDYHKDTLIASFHCESNYLRIVILPGHRPKYLKSRLRGVLKFTQMITRLTAPLGKPIPTDD